MKRTAEKQLVKGDDVSDEETEEAPTTFKKADENALVGRKIRALPKRSAVGSATVNGSSTPEPSTSKPKFSGFSGFGVLSTNTPFTFTTPSTKPASPAIQPPSEAQSRSTEISSPPTAISSTATNTAKTLASFLGAPPDSLTAQRLNSTGPTTSLAFPLAKPSTTTSAPSTSTPVASTPSTTLAEPSDSTIKYYTELRGLNVSLLAAVTKAIQDDVFVDISQILEQYKSQRTRIQDDYDKSKKVETNKTEPSKPKAPLSMPTPPSSFSFGNKTPDSSTFKTNEPSNGGGFKPTVPATANALSSPFKFTSTSPSSSEPSEAGKHPSTTSPFTFGTSTTGSSTSSVFGNISKSESHGLKFTAPPTTGSAASPFGSSNVFGSSSSSAFTQTTPSFGGFGKPPGSGNIGNPVGFGFGAAGSKDTDAITGTKASGFSFGAPSPSPFGAFAPAKKAEERGDGEEGSGGDDASAAAEGDDAAPRVGLSGPSLHDVEGEGEEDEETSHSVKLKAYRLKKPGEKGGEGWVELGVGYLRLKRHKETNARRVLLRNSSTGKISINFNLYSGLKVTQAKKSLTFIGHDIGVAQTYNVRLPNEDQARELKEAIERELALVKPQEG